MRHARYKPLLQSVAGVDVSSMAAAASTIIPEQHLRPHAGGGADMGYKRKMEDEILRPVRRAPKYGRFVDAPMFGRPPPNQRGPSDNVTTVAGAAPLRGRGASSPSLEIAD